MFVAAVAALGCLVKGLDVSTYLAEMACDKRLKASDLRALLYLWARSADGFVSLMVLELSDSAVGQLVERLSLRGLIEQEPGERRYRLTAACLAQLPRINDASPTLARPEPTPEAEAPKLSPAERFKKRPVDEQRQALAEWRHSGLRLDLCRAAALYVVDGRQSAETPEALQLAEQWAERVSPA